MTAGRAWIALLVFAGAFAAIALGHWVEALLSGRPVLYGEGAVANAAILLRDGNPYSDTTGAVAANYPPLYLWLASLGDPFRSGRVVTMLSALAVALIIWWRARGAGGIPRVALGLSWLALTPVAIWGAAVKPDLLAIALTVGGVAALDQALRSGLASREGQARWAMLGGALLAAAVSVKPTALLPASVVLLYVLVLARSVFTRAAFGGAAAAAVALVHANTLGIGDVWRHVVTWNALPWGVEQVVLLLVLGAGTLGILIAAAGMERAFAGLALAYLIGAVGVALLGGREGATINYLLDLSAASVYAAATVAARLSLSTGFPVAAAAQVTLGFALLAPFGLVPGRDAGTGAWGSPDRLAVVQALPPGRHLVEDSGLLIAAGMRPAVDDIFLWTRLANAGVIDPAPLIEDISGAEFATVVTEVDLASLEGAAVYERSRWHRRVVDMIFESYELASSRPLWVYRPR